MMSKARRRRKLSTALSVLAAVPLASAFSFRELGIAPPRDATPWCRNILASELSSCSMTDFRTTCSKSCRGQVERLWKLQSEACGNMIRSENVALVQLCTQHHRRQAPSLTPEVVFATATTTITIDPDQPTQSASSVAPPAEPLPLQQTSDSPLQPIISVDTASPSGSATTRPHRRPSGRPSRGSLLVPPIILPSGSESVSNHASLSSVLGIATSSSQLFPIATPSAALGSAVVPLDSTISWTESGLIGTLAATSASASSLIVQGISEQSVSTSITPTTSNVVISRPTKAPTISVILGSAPMQGSLSTLHASQLSPHNSLQDSNTFIATSSSAPILAVPPTASMMQALSSLTTSTTSSSSSTSLTHSSSATSTTATTAAAGDGALGVSQAPTGDQMRRVNPGIIGGVVGGGIGALAIFFGIMYFMQRRKNQSRERRDSGRRPISSWDFIDGRRNAPPSQGSGSGSNPLPPMRFLEQPIYFNNKPPSAEAPPIPATAQVAMPREVIIKRKSGPPLVVRNAGTGGNRTSNGGRVSGLDERTVEALGIQPLNVPTRPFTGYTASQYSTAGSNIINVGYDGPPPPLPNRMAYGSPGPTVYGGSGYETAATSGPLPQDANMFGASYGSGRQERPRYPSPVEERLGMQLPRRSTFYSPFAGNEPWAPQRGYGRL